MTGSRLDGEQFPANVDIRHVDYFRVPRNPSRVDAKRGNQFPQADLRLDLSGLGPTAP
jgi:hypothetical protein